MLGSSWRGALRKGGRPLCERQVRAFLNIVDKQRDGPKRSAAAPFAAACSRACGAAAAAAGALVDRIPRGRRRYSATPQQAAAKTLTPNALAVGGATAAAVAAAAVAIALSPDDEDMPKKEENMRDNSALEKTMAPRQPSGISRSSNISTASRLSTRRTSGPEYRRRIQDMYHLVDSPVGQGAFGIVCAGVHRETEEVVAVKQIPRRLTKPARLQGEVDLLRVAGHHRNVVNFRDLFSDDQYYYIVMEFATGGELFDRLVHKGAHSEHDAACLLREVADAVAYLHGNNIVHFDLKPENILLQSSDTDSLDVRLVDFGSAFVLGADGLGEPRSNSGTVAYSAPEVLRGEPFGTAADMWSLGVVLYILLSGVHPFDREGGAPDARVRDNILRGDVTFDDPVWAGKEGAIELIEKLVDIDPTRRPTADEVLEHPWLETRASLSRRPMTGAAENLRVFHRGRMRLKACLLAVMAGLAGPEAYIDPSTTVGSRRQALRSMDTGHKDYISTEDLRRTLGLLGEDLSKDELLHMMQASTGRPGEQYTARISYNDFMKLVPPLCPSHLFEEGARIYSAGAMDRNFFLVNRGEISLEIEGRLQRGRGAGSEAAGPLERTGEQAERRVLVTLETLGRGDSFGEGELLAAAEAEEGAVAAAALAAKQQRMQEQAQQDGRQRQRQQGRRKSSRKDSVSASGTPNFPAELRRDTPGEGPGRGAARGGGVPRAHQAVCVSEMCEVMAVPRHLFANLLDDLAGVRRLLEEQARDRASNSLARLVEEDLLEDARTQSYLTNDDVWPVPGGSGSVGAGEDEDAGSAATAAAAAAEARMFSRSEGAGASVLLVQEGSVVVTQGGETRRLVAGDVCVCGVARRGMPAVTRVACGPGRAGASVVHIPLESLRRGGLFTPTSLDAFLRVLSVGYGVPETTWRAIEGINWG